MVVAVITYYSAANTQHGARDKNPWSGNALKEWMSRPCAPQFPLSVWKPEGTSGISQQLCELFPCAFGIYNFYSEKGKGLCKQKSLATPVPLNEIFCPRSLGAQGKEPELRVVGTSSNTDDQRVKRKVKESDSQSVLSDLLQPHRL